MQEIWKSIKGYEGLYEVSSLGRVKTLERVDCRGQHRKERIMRCANVRGYMCVTLSINCSKKMHKVHRLVALAFIPNPSGKPEVNHIDCNKTNNSVGNLEWCTPSENQIHSVKMGTHGNVFGDRHGRRILSESQVLKIKSMKGCGLSQREIGELFGVHPATIGMIFRGKNWARTTEPS